MGDAFDGAVCEIDSQGRARFRCLPVQRLPAPYLGATTGRDLIAPRRRITEHHPDVLVATAGGVPGTPDDITALTDRAKIFAAGARAVATRRAYASDLIHFENWCRRAGLAALPAEPYTLAAYLTAYAESLAVSTMGRRLSAIAVAHREAGYALDLRHRVVRDTWQGIRRAKGTAPRSAAALTLPLLKRLIDTCDGGNLEDLRDRALLAVGFAGAFRRSELCALALTDVVPSPEGLVIRVARSKTDQLGEGELVPVGRTGSPYCPAAAFAAWTAAAGLQDGRVFRSINRHGRIGLGLSTRAVAQIVKDRAELAGLDAKAFSGHSLRAGFATSAAKSRVEEREIMKHTRHKSVSTFRRYVRFADIWERNLVVEIGL
ncbi:Site-specific recombinase XerD [Methylobacterium sp. 174MFSha1.1]|uniref:site-specific integrase n=1 Tax=Methylobacterium sp. 174MFSha1.1 TaxID=1502749 RepID=UPI0008E447E8|nr:site-specific integrase [Methylobacterium sp. 174MFSha1.1]SFV10993.1 Site-specific recombinase XerD [Methylobacterium sp. 174MFSha1.1]